LGLEELKEKYGVKIPYFKEFYNLACNELVDHKILSLVQQRPFTIDELLKEIKESEPWVKTRIKTLVKNKKLFLVDGILKLSLKSKFLK